MRGGSTISAWWSRLCDWLVASSTPPVPDVRVESVLAGRVGRLESELVSLLQLLAALEARVIALEKRTP